MFVCLQDILSFEGFWAPWWKQLLFYLLGFCTFGLAFLIAKWLPKVQVALQYSKCRLKDATYVRITVSSSQYLSSVDLLYPQRRDSLSLAPCQLGRRS